MKKKSTSQSAFFNLRVLIASVFCLIAVGILILSLASVTAAADKVEMCHRPPGNPSNVHIIRVSPDAVAAHLAQGDHFSFGGSCYVVEPGDTNATASEQACQDQFGGHLASIHSQAEDDFISQLVDPNADGGITARIGGVEPGGFCSGPAAIYHWTDGTAWDFSNWRLTTGEPNCTGAPASIQFWPNTNGGLSGWNDTPAGDPLGNFVCKYQPVTAAADRVAICHRPPGNPSNVHIISVSPDDVAGHIAHGDHFSFGGSCYVVEPGDTNATASEQACQDQFGGHLASIHSQAEDDFISQLVDPTAAGGITARIGGTAPSGFCSGPGATYAWTDGTTWDFSNWRLTTGEPNCTGAPASIQFWPNTNGGLSGWNDTPAGDPLGDFVCKYQP